MLFVVDSFDPDKGWQPTQFIRAETYRDALQIETRTSEECVARNSTLVMREADGTLVPLITLEEMKTYRRVRPIIEESFEATKQMIVERKLKQGLIGMDLIEAVMWLQ